MQECSARARRVGARRRLPMNCGSMAKPEGCGKPKVQKVQPAQSSVSLRESPAISRIHCTQQKTQTRAVEKKSDSMKYRRQLGLGFKSGKTKRSAKTAKKVSQRTPAVRIARVGLGDQKAEIVA